MKFKKIKFKKNKEVVAEKSESPKLWLNILKGSLISLALSLVLILIFAFFISLPPLLALVRRFEELLRQK